MKTLRKLLSEQQFSKIEILKTFERLLETEKYLSVEYNIENLLAGFKIELEHAETVDYNLETICSIVLDHLKERKDYYQKLEKVEEMKTLKKFLCEGKDLLNFRGEFIGSIEYELEILEEKLIEKYSNLAAKAYSGKVVTFTGGDYGRNQQKLKLKIDDAGVERFYDTLQMMLGSKGKYYVVSKIHSIE